VTNTTVVLAVDAMGGDHAPHAILKGLDLFHQRCPSCAFLVYGDRRFIEPFLEGKKSLSAMCTVVHTDEVIDSKMKPSQALRLFPRSSMRLALESVASGEAHGAVSAGNTGAYLALSKFILKTLHGIDRPAIASQIPTSKGRHSVMLDLGGTLEVSSRNLLEYALMGDIFAKKVLKIADPKVGLLNVGREESKGSDCLQQAFAMLSQAPINFQGFIEGDDIPLGTVSVIVTDGFTGNVALKTAEGTARFIFSSLKESLLSSVRGKVAAWIGGSFFKELKGHLDPRSYNGALWLGLSGVAVKSHGNTDDVSFSHALEMAYDMVQSKITQAIDEALAKASIPS